MIDPKYFKRFPLEKLSFAAGLYAHAKDIVCPLCKTAGMFHLGTGDPTDPLVCIPCHEKLSPPEHHKKVCEDNAARDPDFKQYLEWLEEQRNAQEKTNP